MGQFTDRPLAFRVPGREDDASSSGERHMARRQNGPHPRDWVDWHAPYEDEHSPLSHRLATVRRRLHEILRERSSPHTRLISVCAGQGDDVIAVLGSKGPHTEVEAWLIELDPRNAAIARSRARAAGLSMVKVVEADAGSLATYQDLVPADVVLLCGVFGNIPDSDIVNTIEVLPQLVGEGGSVIWTRSRRAPDITPWIRTTFVARRFIEVSFDAPVEYRWSVGVNVFNGATQQLRRSGRMFAFGRGEG